MSTNTTAKVAHVAHNHDQGTMYNSFFTAVASNQGLLICRERAGFSTGRASLLVSRAVFYYRLFAGLLRRFRNLMQEPSGPTFVHIT